MIEEDIVKILTDKNLKISTAESCTGGLVASKLVNVSGASKVFEEGYITYSNAVKMKLLGVNKSVLDKYTEVSSECAALMAYGCLHKSGSDIAVSVTGYAGPYDSEEEPKGLVYIGCAYHEKAVAEKFRFEGSRMDIREQAAVAALNMAYKIILEKF